MPGATELVAAYAMIGDSKTCKLAIATAARWAREDEAARRQASAARDEDHFFPANANR